MRERTVTSAPSPAYFTMKRRGLFRAGISDMSTVRATWAVASAVGQPFASTASGRPSSLDAEGRSVVPWAAEPRPGKSRFAAANRTDARRGGLGVRGGASLPRTWSAHRDLNPEPRTYEVPALTIELWADRPILRAMPTGATFFAQNLRSHRRLRCESDRNGAARKNQGASCRYDFHLRTSTPLSGATGMQF